MTRILMISDIHGCCDPFNELLEVLNYQSSNDQLIILGDYVDRGPKSRETVDRVIDLVENHHVIALRGNHDQRLVDLIRTDNSVVKSKFLEHGGLQTLQSYCDFIDDSVDDTQFQEAIDYIRIHFSTHIDFLESLPLYHEDKEHIYVHAGLNPQYKNWKEQPAHDFMYIKSEFHRSKSIADKIVIFGHTRTIELQQSADIWFNQDKIGIDGGCAYGLQLNCLIYKDGSYESEHIKGG